MTKLTSTIGAAGLFLAAVASAAAAPKPGQRRPVQRVYEAPISGSLYPTPGANNSLRALVGPDGRANAAGAEYQLNKSARQTD
jgi:hypothetical protein